MKFCSSIFTTIGIILCCLGIGIFFNTKNFVNKADEINGIINNIEMYYTTDSDGDKIKNYNVYVSYDYHGESYNNIELNEYNNSMYVGKDIKILIDPKNPTKIMDASFPYFTSLLILFIGIIFISIGTPLLIKEIKEDKKDKMAKLKGKHIKAKIIDIEHDTSFKINGKPSEVLICKYISETGQEYIYKSRRIMKYNSIPIGQTIDVYINEETGHEFVDYKNSI